MVKSNVIDWGQLKPLIDNENITDIKCNSRSIWTKDVTLGTKKEDFNVDASEIEYITRQIGNQVDAVFNESDPVLQADYGDLRVQILHKTVSPSGINMTIRKTPYTMRISENEVESNKYCTSLVMELIKACVQSKMGIVNCGETGSGKTELMKLATSFIPAHQGVVTIEDTSELHLATLFPDRNIIELKINDKFFNFDEANKSSMRMDPDWVLFSEARGAEIEKLIACRSVGHGIITTMHMLNSTSLSERIINMYDPLRRPNDNIIQNMVHEYFDVVIHIKCDFDEKSTLRYIDEISLYERTEKQNKITTIYRSKKGINEVEYIKIPTIFEKRLSAELVESWNSYANV